MKRIYLDNAASTPVALEVEAIMRPYFLNKFGNAGSLHSFGQEAIAALDESRETIANAIGANFREIIFTGSATEANNLALRGSIRRFTQMRRGLTQINISDNQRKISEHLRPRLIISSIEHESVLETARDLEKKGVEVIYIPVSKKGIVDPKKLKGALNERTVLVSVMYANNEIGTIQPIAEIAKIISEYRDAKNANSMRIPRIENKNYNSQHSRSLADWHRFPLFHTDAVQAFQFLDCDVKKLGVDLMTLSGHKIYGPKGVGALYVNNELRIMNNGKTNKKPIIRNSSFIIHPLITGGGQEFGLRSGTENIPLIVGLAEAVRLVAKKREREGERISKLRDYLWNGIKKIYPKAERNGDAEKVLPNFLNVYFPGYEAADLLVRLDLAGMAVSTGSACTARSAEPSYVIMALDTPDSLRDSNRVSLKKQQSSSSIRITLGRQTSKGDIDTFLKIIRKLIGNQK